MRINCLTIVGTLLLIANSAPLQVGHLCFAQNPSSPQVQRNDGVATNPLAGSGGAQPLKPQGASPGSSIASPTNSQTTSTIRWRSNLSEARNEARQSGKPILLHFYKDNCVYCEKIEKGAFRDPMVSAELEAKFVPVKVFAPDNATATQALRVDRFPTDVIVNADGVVLMRTVSPLDPYAYVSMLNSISEEHRRVAAQYGRGIQGSQTSQASNSQTSPAIAPAQPQNNWSNYAAENGNALSGNSPAGSTSIDQRGSLSGPANQVMANQFTANQAMASKSDFNGPYNQASPHMTQVYPQQAPLSQQAPFSQQDAYVASASQFPSPQASAPGMPLQAFSPQPAALLASVPQDAAFGSVAGPVPGQTLGQDRGQAPIAQQPAIDVAPAEPMMEGYCLVTLVEDFAWKLGKPEVGAMHLGQLYVFASIAARDKFLEDPNRYAPVMNGLDVVKFFDEGQIVKGIRAKGCTTENPSRLFFFSSEETLAKFESSEQARAYYTQRAIELSERAAAEANDRTKR